MRSVSQRGAELKFNLNNQERPGICAEIAKALEKQEIKISGLDAVVPLRRIELLLEEGDIDIVLCLLVNPERQKRFHYLETEIYAINHVLVGRAAEEKNITSLEELKEYSQTEKVMTISGSSLASFLEASGVQIDAGAQDEVTLLKKLQMGRGRYAYMQDLALKAIFESGDLKRKDFKIFPTIFKSESQKIAYSKKMKLKAIRKLKNAIEQLKKSGELDKILKKYR